MNLLAHQCDCDCLYLFSLRQHIGCFDSTLIAMARRNNNKNKRRCRCLLDDGRLMQLIRMFCTQNTFLWSARIMFYQNMQMNSQLTLTHSAIQLIWVMKKSFQCFSSALFSFSVPVYSAKTDGRSMNENMLSDCECAWANATHHTSINL